MDFILWLILGGIAGWIASKIMGTDAQQGILLNIVVGVIGAMIGGFLARNLLGVEGNNIIVSLLIAVVGACILLFLVGLVTGNRRRV